MNKTGSFRQLRITLIAGFVFLLISGAIITVLYLYERSSTRAARQEENFNKILSDYDSAFSELAFSEREFNLLNAELDRLEKLAVTVESWLSVLKRRRILAVIHQPSAVNYSKSLDNALKAYPSSQPVIAVAAAHLVKNTAINPEIDEQLRNSLELLSDPSYNTLRLALHVILRDFGSPKKADVIPDRLVSDITVGNTGWAEFPGSEIININLAILKVLRRDYRGASADIQALLNSPSANALYFAAEYHYDFGDLLRSAEIYSWLSGFEYVPLETQYISSDKAMSRQADALYLAGFSDMASAIWNMLAEDLNETSLYNLAVTADDRSTYAIWLEKLVNIETISDINNRNTMAAKQFGLIRYSRLHDNSAAINMLQRNRFFPAQNNPYIDLEINKRSIQGQNPARQLAQTWMLLDRHEKNEDLYKWAAWHFLFQRHFNEIPILLDRIDLYDQVEFSLWTDFYKAVQYMLDGRLDTAENILRSIPHNDADWYVYANLGRIYETIRSPVRALEYYELAFARLSRDLFGILPANPYERSLQNQNYKNASRIQFRIARCLTVLNRQSEIRRVLEYALDLDPDNLTARLELDRLIFNY